MTANYIVYYTRPYVLFVYINAHPTNVPFLETRQRGGAVGGGCSGRG